MEALAQILDRTSFQKSSQPSTTFSTSAEQLAEYAVQRAAWANAVPGTLTGHDCPDCLNRGYSMIPTENGELVARPCRCVALRSAQSTMRRCGIAPEVLDTCTWEHWQKPEKWQERAEEMGRAFVRRVLEEPGFSGWFVAAGRPGSGKTRLCSTILREILLGGKRGLYVSWRDFSRQAKGVANDAERFRALVDPIKDAPILYCDDLLKGHATGPDLNLIFEVLNERYAAGRPTIISSELTIDTIVRGDEGVGSRIAEKSKGFYLDLSRARNWRLDHAAG